jgi:FkbM family methyltransferase
VHCYECALGGQGEVDLHVVSVDGGGSTLQPRPELGPSLSIEKVRHAQLDDFDLGHVGLIKIDAEGSELNVLRGAQRTIAMYRPRLLLEAWLHNWYADQRLELIKFVESLGYKVEPVNDWPEMLIAEPL